MEADPAFARAARRGVLHAVAGEDVETAVVAGDRKRDDERALELAQITSEAGIEVECLRRAGELRERGIEELVTGALRARHLQDGHR